MTLQCLAGATYARASSTSRCQSRWWIAVVLPLALATAACPFPPVDVVVGLDSDTELGPLDTDVDETDDTDVLPLQTLVGDLIVTGNQDMVDFCLDYQAVDGHVSFSGPVLVDTRALDCLVWVSGDVEVDTIYLQDLSLPALTFVGGKVALGPAYNTISEPSQLLSVELPALEEVGSDFDLSRAELIETLSLPKLHHVGTDFSIFFNNQLTSMHAPQLTWIGGVLNVIGNHLLSDWSLPSDAYIGYRVSFNSNSPTVDALEDSYAAGVVTPTGASYRPGADPTYRGDLVLETDEELDTFCETHDVVVGDLYLSGSLADTSGLGCLTGVEGNLFVVAPGLTTLTLPNLREVTGQVRLMELESLEEIDLPMLSDVGGSVL